MVASLQAGNMELGNVRHLILDEGDRLLDQEFLEQVKEIMGGCTHDDLQTAVFSATLPASAETIALSAMRDPIRIVVGLKYVLFLRRCLSKKDDQRHAPTSHRPVTDLRLL